MKTISELAYNAIIEANITDTENVGINTVINSDWNGTLRIIIAEDGGNVDSETQFGAIAQTTVLHIEVLSSNRNEAVEKCHLAAQHAFRYIEKLERKQGYGILAITKNQNGIENIPDSHEFKAFRSFNVLNSINI
jgi:hypothetical protein